MIRALIFDFDGTILETEGPVFQSWEEVYKAYGCQLSLEEWATNIGTAEEPFIPLDDLEKRLGRSLDRSAIEQRRRQREIELVLSQPALAGVENYLRDAHRLGLKLGLASSSTCQWVTSHLSRLGFLEYFDVVNAGDDVPLTKPDPAVYEITLEQLGVRPEQAVAFEDSPNGVLAAKRAGVFCVAVPNPITRSLSIDHADLHLNSLAEMPLEELLFCIEGSQKSS